MALQGRAPSTPWQSVRADETLIITVTPAKLEFVLEAAGPAPDRPFRPSGVTAMMCF